MKRTGKQQRALVMIVSPLGASGIMRRMNTPQPVKGHLLAMLLACSALALCHAACIGALNPTNRSHPLIGKAAPEISAEPVGGEGPKTLNAALGKVVILDFWATWCGPCKRSFAVYQAIADRFPSDVAVIAVSTDEPGIKTKADLLAFATDTHVKFSIVWDKDGSTRALYGGMRSLPSAFILDRSGTVRHLHAGYGPGYDATVTQEVQQLVNAAPDRRQATASLGTAPPKAISCEPSTLSDLLAEFGSGWTQNCARKKGCMKSVAKSFHCLECEKASCCAETQACDWNGFAPGTPARADARRCACLMGCTRKHSLPECVSDERCGSAKDPAADPYPALASCSKAHCDSICPTEDPTGGPP